MTYKQWYLYGVTTASAAQYARHAMIGTDIVEIVEVGELAILASEVPFRRIESPFLYARYEALAQALYQKIPFLPFSAHTVVPSEKEIHEILTQNSGILLGKTQEYLQLAEFRVKVSWNDLNLVFKEISGITPGLASLYNLVKQSNDIEAITHLGAIFDAALSEKKEEVAEIWLLALSKWAVHTKNRENVQDAVCFDASFLVVNELCRQFGKLLEDLQVRYQRTQKLSAHGPVPPTSFVRLRLGKNLKLRHRKQEWLPEF
jgi:Gas vesicle synthesis protein GvpL/GvpF